MNESPDPPPEQYCVEGTPFVVERVRAGRWEVSHENGMIIGNLAWTTPFLAADAIRSFWASLNKGERAELDRAAITRKPIRNGSLPRLVGKILTVRRSADFGKVSLVNCLSNEE